jgi:hypothetical protein
MPYSDPLPALQDQRKPTRPGSRHHEAQHLSLAAQNSRGRRKHSRNPVSDQSERGIQQNGPSRKEAGVKTFNSAMLAETSYFDYCI